MEKCPGRLIRRTFLCLVLCSVASLFLAFCFLANHTLPSWLSVSTKTVEKERENKSFLYYVQTASCLSEYYLQSDLLGNAVSCNCDVLVLSYRTGCLNNNVTHVRYIFANSTTWTVGRNLLYKQAQLTFENYDQYIYHTFMDEDMRWIWSDWQNFDVNINQTMLSPMRAYEQHLLRDLPAFGSPNYYYTCDYNNKAFMKTFLSEHSCGQQCVVDTTRKFPTSCLSIAPDGSVGSFHKRTIDKLLPYSDQYEKKSWWVSQQILRIRLYVRFHNTICVTCQ